MNTLFDRRLKRWQYWLALPALVASYIFLQYPVGFVIGMGIGYFGSLELWTDADFATLGAGIEWVMFGLYLIGVYLVCLWRVNDAGKHPGWALGALVLPVIWVIIGLGKSKEDEAADRDAFYATLEPAE